MNDLCKMIITVMIITKQYIGIYRAFFYVQYIFVFTVAINIW